MDEKAKIPNPTIERLALYSRPLEVLVDTGPLVISSERLAELCGVNPAQVRKDLAYFGEFGVRGVGYEVRDLLHEIKKILATNREWTLCIVGMGNLGKSLAQNDNLRKRGYVLAAAFDVDPEKVGGKLPNGLIIEPAEKIREIIAKRSIEIGMITTPPQMAQRVSNILFDAGVKAILNFAPIHVRTPECCIVENMDFSVKLEHLAYHIEQLPKRKK